MNSHNPFIARLRGKAVTAQALSTREQKGCEGMYHPLTGLPCRKLLQRRLDEIVNDATQQDACITLLSLTVERYDLIRDIAGESGANHVIHTVASRLARLAGNGDILAHIEEDQFTIARISHDADDIDVLHRQVMTTLPEAICIGAHQFHITILAELTLYPTE